MVSKEKKSIFWLKICFRHYRSIFKQKMGFNFFTGKMIKPGGGEVRGGFGQRPHFFRIFLLPSLRERCKKQKKLTNLSLYLCMKAIVGKSDFASGILFFGEYFSKFSEFFFSNFLEYFPNILSIFLNFEYIFRIFRVSF